jgi:hypothetical protein
MLRNSKIFPRVRYLGTYVDRAGLFACYVRATSITLTIAHGSRP